MKEIFRWGKGLGKEKKKAEEISRENKSGCKLFWPLLTVQTLLLPLYTKTWRYKTSRVTLGKKYWQQRRPRSVGGHNIDVTKEKTLVIRKEEHPGNGRI